MIMPDMRQATVWNVAVNGVMAGCRPEYLPVLLAIAEAMGIPATASSMAVTRPACRCS